MQDGGHTQDEPAGRDARAGGDTQAGQGAGTARRAARAWTRSQSRASRGAVGRATGLSLLGTAAAIGQAAAVGIALTGAGTTRSGAAIAAFAALALVRMALGLGVERVTTAAGAAARSRLRRDALARLLAAGPSLLRDHARGALAGVVVDRIEALDGLFARWLPAARMAVAGPVLVAAAVAVIDWRAAAILAATGLLVPFGMALSGIGAAAASRRQFTALERLQARFLDRMRGIATIVLAGRAQDEAARLAAAADELRRRTMRVLRVAFLSSAVLDCAAAAALVLIALRDGVLLTQHRLDPVVALVTLLLVPEFFAPLRAFAAAYQDRLHAAGAAEALVTLPDLPAPVAAAPAIRTVAARGIGVAFDDVRLVWDPARPPALDGLSFRVAAGETLVLAGPSGAGKSSVIELLLGFVRPSAGRVLLNGADIATIVPAALAELTAWIGQRPLLFAASIADNIRFARPDATEAELAAAVRNARVDRFARILPDGLDTVIGEGGHGLSGGEAQRIAIARAFLRNAPLLLLDEPTAHLDPTTEAEVLESLRHLAGGRTVILATHSAAARNFGGRRLDLAAGRAAGVRGAA